MGRHMTIRKPELADVIVDGISRGEPLRQLCRDLRVSKSAVYDWIDADDEFAGRFRRARELGFDVIAEDCLEIADDSRNDWIAALAGTGDQQAIVALANPESTQRSRLRVETRLKLLAKWDPKRYGELIKVGDPAGNALKPAVMQFVGIESLK